MRSFTTTLAAVVTMAAGLVAASAPASALGGCGPNRHRNPYGYCVWGGQNQAWCLRHTGHVAGFGPYGTRWCGR